MNRALKIFISLFVIVAIISMVLLFIFNMPESFKKLFETIPDNLTKEEPIYLTISLYDNSTYQKINGSYIIYNRGGRLEEGGVIGYISEQIFLDYTVQSCEKDTEPKDKECTCNDKYPYYQYCTEQDYKGCCIGQCLPNCPSTMHAEGNRCHCNKDYSIIGSRQNYYSSQTKCNKNSECKIFLNPIGTLETFNKEHITIGEGEYTDSLLFQSINGSIKNMKICIKWSSSVLNAKLNLIPSEKPTHISYYDTCYDYPKEISANTIQSISYIITLYKDPENDYVEFYYTDMYGGDYQINSKDIGMIDKIDKIYID